MNRLQYEASPYLRQHAANPVDWHPWGAAALERARRQDKPILVSIGYSTCHWCHVMERESFEDTDIAAFQNAHFINIKIDREERPDLDQLYMESCQAITGQGGWPLNVFLTPDQRPYYAGTYFPPAPQGRRLSWSQALQYAAYNFYENRQAVEKQADRILQRLRRAEQKALPPLEGLPEQASPFTRELAERLFQQLHAQFDSSEGGFGAPPKFPNTMALEFLMHYARKTGTTDARQHALFSLDRLLQGGIYDHLGGGLARYAVDREWRVPHFEKMLYDNALLIRLLADAWRWTGAARYRRALEQCIAFAERELSSPEGGFYTALDADSEGREGAYYTWQRPEIEAILGEEASWFCEYFQVTEAGNWEGRNILIARSSLEQFAEEEGMEIEELTGRLAQAVERLHAARQRRPRPHRDEKILLGWNALMVTAYVQAWHALGQDAYRERAEQCLRFLLDAFPSSASGLRHVYQGGQARQTAFLNDYAFLIEALLEAYTLRYDTALLDRAAALTEEALRLFSDEEQRLFYFSAGQSDGPILRRRELYDAEMPSGNALMAANLQRLGLLFDRPDWRERVGRMLQSLLPALTDDPLPFARWATAVLAEIDGFDEVAIVGPRAHALADKLQRHFLPNLLLMAHPAGDDRYPLLRHRPATDDTLLYLCRNYACQRPVDSVEGVLEMVG